MLRREGPTLHGPLLEVYQQEEIEEAWTKLVSRWVDVTHVVNRSKLPENELGMNSA